MLIIGHRGARAVRPENTLAAIREGMQCADFVEVDVRLSRDGVPVVIHDATLDRTTNGSGPVGTLLRSELEVLDAGEGERIPTLPEVADLVSGGCGLVVEIKEPGSEEIVCRALGEELPDPLMVVSFHPESLVRVRELLPGVRTGLIVSRPEGDPVALATSLHAAVLLPKKDLVSQELVGRAHAAGLLVVAWTLNVTDEMDRASASGVDGWASDDPCLSRKHLRRRV